MRVQCHPCEGETGPLTAMIKQVCIADPNLGNGRVVITSSLRQRLRPRIDVDMFHLRATLSNGFGDKDVVDLLGPLLVYVRVPFQRRNTRHIVDISYEPSECAEDRSSLDIFVHVAGENDASISILRQY